MDGDSTEWDAICRICLQEGDMHSIFDSFDDDFTTDGEFITIANKIMLCSPIEIKQGMNMPEQICNTCLNKLEVAYEFRKSCERSDAILQSFIENDVQPEYVNDRSVTVNSESGAVYKYKPPDGLNIKRVKADTPMDIHEIFIKNEPYSDQELETETSEKVVYRKVARPPPRKNVSKRVPATSVYMVTESESIETLADTDAVDFETLDQLENFKTVRTNKVRLGLTKKDESDAGNSSANSTSPKGSRFSRSKQAREQKAPKVCEICGNTYKYQHALESHMRRHRNEKPFECKVCGKGFVINFELNRHMRTHTGQKPYACKYCDRRFSDFGSRVKHERTHTGERPYACDTCGKTFTYSHVLSSHNLIHTGEKKYHCEICGKRFAKSHHLKAHHNTHAKQMTQKKNSETKMFSKEKDRNPTVIDDPGVSIDQYIIATDGQTICAEDSVDEGEQLLLYGDVDVLTEYKPTRAELQKMSKTQYIEDENGIQHEITIEEQQDAIELLTFEDDQLE